MSNLEKPLEMRVAILENAVQSTLKIVKQQNESLSKMAEALSAILKKMAADSQETKGE